MNSLELTNENEIRLKSERKIYKFLKVLVKRSLLKFAYLIASFNMFTARQHSLTCANS